LGKGQWFAAGFIGKFLERENIYHARFAKKFRWKFGGVLATAPDPLPIGPPPATGKRIPRGIPRPALGRSHHYHPPNQPSLFYSFSLFLCLPKHRQSPLLRQTADFRMLNRRILKLSIPAFPA
jgi:hypothetical protein